MNGDLRQRHEIQIHFIRKWNNVFENEQCNSHIEKEMYDV